MTQSCAQPGCTGTIEDGYCNVCGLAPAATPVVSTPSGRSTRGTTGTRRTTSGRTSSRRIGAGLVTVPEMPVPDPMSVVMANPEVAESKRFCGNCGEPVGRAKAGHPGRLEGFCGKCRHRFSFTPKLVPGDVVGEQYEVVGCLAHGGLGWIYLARDQHVSNRWVVMKGLLDSGDEDALAAAMAEARFLAAVEHPNIVKIYNFVEHQGAGYTVMEYVGGTSLKDLLESRRTANAGKPDPLPPPQAMAYMLEILPAFGYLHRMGLVFCDFKPDNVILQGEALKLIDLGGVRRVDDAEGAVYGTVGYQAPEIADRGPSPASDLFTVARTLAVLIMDFKGYQSKYKASLPPVSEQPLLAAFDSLHRWLDKGTASDPDDRFQSADEMAEQLLGVLREVLAQDEGTPKPASSPWFHGDTASVITDVPDWRLLPTLKTDPNDVAAALLTTLPQTDAVELVHVLSNAPMQTVEVTLRLARAEIDAGLADAAAKTLDGIEKDDPWEWRAAWYRGLLAMAGNDLATARQMFDRVYRDVPGELAPQLALAMVAEAAGDLTTAARFYDVVSRTDPSFTTACYGLGRTLAALGDRNEAVAAYGRVPQASIAYVDAQLRAARILVAVGKGAPPGASELTKASATVAHLTLDAEQRARTTSQLLEAALDLVQAGVVAPSGQVVVLGSPLEERSLRLGLERAYRDLARLADSPAERIRLVDRANHVRPRTLV
jgi:serine/threonine-protein kinase PknG